MIIKAVRNNEMCTKFTHIRKKKQGTGGDVIILEEAAYVSSGKFPADVSGCPETSLVN